MITVSTHALRYRIWAYCAPREWNCTIGEVADALDEDVNRIRATMQHAGWTSRIRLTMHDSFGDGVPGSRTYADHLARQIAAGFVGVDE